MKTILLISPYWKEPHRWMVSSFKMAELWQRIGYRVVVACMGDMRSQESGVRSQFENLSPTLRIYRKKDIFLPDPWNYGMAFGFTGMVRKIIREERPDLIVCNKVLFWTSLSVIALRATGHKVLLLTDALVGITWHPRGRLPRLVMSLGGWTVGQVVLRCARKIIFFHPQPESVLKKLGIAHKSQVIPTGIDPIPYAGDRVSHHPQVNVTYVGRLESIKGVDDFLEAVHPLLGQYPYLTVQVAGWYADGNPLVSTYEGVKFLGLREDIPALLKETDIFVLPSHSEGLSNALMEAMASGCACIASDVGGNAFLIQNGISGFLFPAGDREALRSHIERLLKDPSKVKSLGEAARRRIEEEFSWKIIGERYRALFFGLLSTDGNA
jgi:glycosyltransferase involved in cell wall biosynthesis